jgi:hypothetical protein
MVLKCLGLMSSKHREPWCRVELGGCRVVLADGQVVGYGTCRVNRHFKLSNYLALLFLFTL